MLILSAFSQIHVVTEKRLYTSWADWDNPERAFINQTFGITRGKTLLNALHFYMGRNGYTQVSEKAALHIGLNC